MFLGIKLTSRSAKPSRNYSPDLDSLRTWLYACIQNATDIVAASLQDSEAWKKHMQQLSCTKTDRNFTFSDLLSDGQILYTLAYTLQYTYSERQNDKDEKAVQGMFRTTIRRNLHHVSTFHSMERVKLFLKWCEEVVQLEKHLVFTSVQLCDDKDEQAITSCLHALCNRFPLSKRSEPEEDSEVSSNQISDRASIKSQKISSFKGNRSRLEDFMNRFTDKKQLNCDAKPKKEPETRNEASINIDNPQTTQLRHTHDIGRSCAKPVPLSREPSKLDMFLQQVPRPYPTITTDAVEVEGNGNNETDTEIDTEDEVSECDRARQSSHDSVIEPEEYALEDCQSPAMLSLPISPNLQAFLGDDDSSVFDSFQIKVDHFCNSYQEQLQELSGRLVSEQYRIRVLELHSRNQDREIEGLKETLDKVQRQLRMYREDENALRYAARLAYKARDEAYARLDC